MVLQLQKYITIVTYITLSYEMFPIDFECTNKLSSVNDSVLYKNYMSQNLYKNL